jgi:hypothetical protein
MLTVRVVQGSKSVGDASQPGAVIIGGGCLVYCGDVVELCEREAISEIRRGRCELVLGQQLSERGRLFYEGKSRNY